ncbi:MAG: hypothetical protein OWU33_05205 [Firmicutes bacterium]|nr:hypothetical protein [Bacillota bacterium]
MPEKNLLASFATLSAAQQCQQALRDRGFDVVQVDHLTAPGGDTLPHMPLVEWGRYGYQTDRLDDKWTSAAAWNDGADGLLTGASWLLTAVVPAADAETAAQIIKQHGGNL